MMGVVSAEQARQRILRDAPFHDAGYGYDELGLHPPALASAVTAGKLLYERYFRVRSSGIHLLPPGPAIVIANHAGVLPVDGAMLCLDILLRSQPARIPRMITDRFVPRLPLVGTLFSRLGVVSGTRANMRHLLERGELVIVFPEGVSGPAKHFRDRYQLQSWSAGFVELAIRHRAPIVPVAVLGAEESWPLVAKVGARLFGAPYFPIPLTPLPLPVRYEITYGTPFWFSHPSADADDPRVITAASHMARTRLEQTIANARLARRGLFR